MPKVVKITPKGKKDLQDELEALKARRPEIAEKIALARSYGDLSENEDYSAARGEQNVVEGRIQEIEDILLHAKLIDSKQNDRIEMGSTVTLEGAGRTMTYMMVSEIEADPLNAKISNKSPIGAQLMGKRVDDEVTMPNGKILKITSIE